MRGERLSSWKMGDWWFSCWETKPEGFLKEIERSSTLARSLSSTPGIPASPSCLLFSFPHGIWLFEGSSFLSAVFSSTLGIFSGSTWSCTPNSFPSFDWNLWASCFCCCKKWSANLLIFSSDCALSSLSCYLHWKLIVRWVLLFLWCWSSCRIHPWLSSASYSLEWSMSAIRCDTLFCSLTLPSSFPRVP